MTHTLLTQLREDIAFNENLIEQIRHGARIVEKTPQASCELDRTDELLRFAEVAIEQLKVETDAVEAASSQGRELSDAIWQSLLSVVAG